MKKNIFEAYMNKLLDLPLWIKQAIYVKLRENLQKYEHNAFLNNNSEELFSLYEPTLTFSGKMELMNKKVGLDNNIYNFLGMSEKNYSILEIAMNMFLTMEEASKLFVFCVEQNYIEQPISDDMYEIAKIMSGKLNIEDITKNRKEKFLKRINEESKKRVVLDYNSIPDFEMKLDVSQERMSVELDALKQENQKLKRKELHILEFIKNHV